MKDKNLKKSKKPDWIGNKEKHPTPPLNRVWLYGIHAVRDAIKNQNRLKYKLMLTQNAHKKIKDLLITSPLIPEILHPRKFLPPLERNAVHQGVALEVSPLNWGPLSRVCATNNNNK